MRNVFFIYLFIFLVVTSCDVETKLEDVISKTWTLKWKKCGLYQYSIDAKINFNVTDSVNDGWYQEMGDTSFFYFSVINDELIQIDSCSSVTWLGSLEVTRYSSNLLEFKRSKQDCSNELFSFQ